MKTEATSRTASLHHLPLLSTSVSSSLLPFTFSSLLPFSQAQMLSCRGVAAESFAGAAGTISLGRLFLDPASLPSL